MKKYILLAVFISLSLVVTGKSAFAQTNCDSIYGGGTNCGTNGFVLKKQVADPTNTSKFVDNLGTNDPHYKSGNLVYFKLIMINNTNSDLTGVTLTDNLPKFITYQGDPTLYNKNTNSVTFTVGTVKKGQTQTQSVVGIIAKAQDLPSNQQITCVVNQAQANAANGQGTQASSQFCIEKTQSASPAPTQQPQTTKGGLPIANQAQPTPIQSEPTAVPQQTQQNQGSNQPAQQPNNQAQNQASTTKGGLPVVNQTQPTPIQSGQTQSPSYPVYTPAANTQQTPKSGPEALPLLAMIPTGAFGIWLRRKAK